MYGDIFFSLYDIGYSRRGSMYVDPYGDDIYAGRAPVSQRAYRALDDAKQTFLTHLVGVDTSGGPVTEEIIRYHLVPDMRKAFKDFVKGYGCTATQRKLTRAEQDKVNKTRKSLMVYTSVTVTPAAQQQYLAANPQKAKRQNANAVAGSSKAGAATAIAAPLQTSQTLKRSANAAALPDASASKKQKK
ncbi:hypothetical protein MKEN_00565900 [Mycena kentingensis (nom. inval.)]|nr:hypothetical protein MKEN_00565900 [Mycena kentingensis (nom. inval.)]